MTKAVAVKREFPEARISRSPEETRAFARECAASAVKDDVWLLSGPLGAGKTLFVQAFVAALGGDREACSPTFSLIQSFSTSRGPVHHMDLYRLKHPAELYGLGFEEALAEGMSLIEWPEIAFDHPMLSDALMVTLKPLANEGDVRALEVAPFERFRGA